MENIVNVIVPYPVLRVHKIQIDTQLYNSEIFQKSNYLGTYL